MSDERTFTIDIRAPQQAVWEALTRTGAKQRFYFDSVLETELRPGASLRYVTEDRKHVFIEGQLTAVEPPRMLAHTLRFTDIAEPATPVRIELQAKGELTRVVLTHDLAGAPRHAKRVGSGWPTILRNLKSLLETGDIPFGWRILYGLMKLAMPLMPRSSR